jgi:hypothetical protein
VIALRLQPNSSSNGVMNTPNAYAAIPIENPVERNATQATCQP